MVYAPRKSTEELLKKYGIEKEKKETFVIETEDYNISVSGKSKEDVKQRFLKEHPDKVVTAVYTEAEYEPPTTEYIIVGDHKKSGNKECLINLAGAKIKGAKKRLQETIAEHSNECDNIKIKEVESKNSWWNDPILRN